MTDPLPSRAALSQQFWASVNKTETCWLWTGSRRGSKRSPYGAFRNQGAHRVAWQLTHGAIPPGLFVCHTCDVPLCVNPAHLFLGTPLDNIRDAKAKGRLVAWNRGKTHCRYGHEFTAHNTLMRPSGKRRCRTCVRLFRARAALRKAGKPEEADRVEPLTNFIGNYRCACGMRVRVYDFVPEQPRCYRCAQRWAMSEGAGA